MHPFVLERPSELAAALALRAQAGRTDAPVEVIAAITVPASAVTRHSHYLKVRDRASFEFALVAAAVALEMDGERIRQARVALGGVGTKPWRGRPGRGPPGGKRGGAAGARPGGGAPPPGGG